MHIFSTWLLHPRSGFYCLIPACLLIASMIPGPGLNAQNDNSEILKQMLSSFAASVSIHPQKINTGIPAAYLPAIETDSTAGFQLLISMPELRYSRIKKKTLSREIRLTVSRSDSPFLTQTLSRTDTLSAKSLKKRLRKEPDWLQGDPPLPGEKFLKPAVIVTASVAAIISLFYIRSR